MTHLVEHPIVAAVQQFVDAEVRPQARALEGADRYPHDLVARMRDLGLFGALVPAAYGGLGLDVTTYARVIEELCRGFMSLAGVINSHTMAALIVLHHGTDEQRQRLLPRLAAGQARGGLCLTEPHAGSDVQAIRTVARRDGDTYRISGSKMFVTNGREGNTFALLALTDPAAQPRHRGMSCFVVEKGAPGLRVVKSIGKLGYRGVDTAELLFEEFPVPAANLVGGVEGRGFKHVMSGLETGRINIAARAVGVGQAAVDAALRHRRAAAGAPPVLADMVARLTAARLTTYWAAGMKDRAERCDLEAGMAKLLASETAQALAVDAMRVHGEAGQLAAFEVERHYRDAPLMIIGEGTNEIQRTLIARQLLERHGERLGALTSREGEPEERRQMVLAVRQFVEKAIVPVAAEQERAGRYPAEIVDGLRDLGVLGALVPAEEGGLGLDPATWAMIVEELARGWTTVAAIVADHTVATAALARFGDDRAEGLPGAAPGATQARRRPAQAGGPIERRVAHGALLARMARGEVLGALALSGAASARREADAGREGICVLTGSTGLVGAADRAGVIVVMAASEEGGRICVAVPGGTEGMTLAGPDEMLGARGLEGRRLILDGVRLPGTAVLGPARVRRVDGAREGPGGASADTGARARETHPGGPGADTGVCAPGTHPGGPGADIWTRAPESHPGGLGADTGARPPETDSADTRAATGARARGTDPAGTADGPGRERHAGPGLEVFGGPETQAAEAHAAEATLALARLGLAATGVGLAQAAFEAALRYSQQRVAFGRAICHHQAVQLMLADMATGITAARLLTAHAAERLADDPADPAAAMARLYAADVAARATLDAMRIHGGYGYTDEFPVERFYRDAPRLGLALGGADRERRELAARLAGPAGAR